MNALSAFTDQELWHIAGWTMLHYLWLGTLVGLVAILCRVLLRRAAANVRYATALACLTLLAALPAGIATWLMSNPPPFQGGAGGGFIEPIAIIELNSPEINPPAAPTDHNVIDLRDQQEPPTVADAQLEIGVDPATLPNSEPSPNPSLHGRGISVAAIDACVPYLPWLWIIGTPITFALLAAGIVGTKRLRGASRALNDGPVIELSSRLASSLHLARQVSVAICDRIASPVLVGIVRPVILLPPAALSGWSPDEIEMVLLHELAHVRRWDNLVNLIQRLIESLLFFHPAVWLVSTWVRRERETCCDAFVVRRTERPHAYAELLVALAAQMPRSVLFHPAASSAISAGPLRTRIRRILQLEDDPMLISGKSLALMLASLFIAATLAVLYVPTIGQAEESTTEVTEDTETKDLADETPSDVADTKESEAVEIESNPHDAQSEAPNAERKDTDEPQVVATITQEEMLRDPMALLRAYQAARQNKQYVDVEYRKGRDATLVVVPEPTEANWPDVLGESPRKDRVIAEKAYARLGLKLAPLSALEVMFREYKNQRTGVLIFGGDVPKGLPLPSLLTSVGGVGISDMNGIMDWLESNAGRSNESVRCYATADDKEYLFDAAQPATTPASAAAPPTANTPTSNAEIEILKQHIKSLEPQFERFHELYKKGIRGGSKDRFEIVAYELADAKGDLELAQGDHQAAIAQYKDALKHAEAALPAVQAAFDAGNADQSDVLQSTTKLLNIKRKLIQVQQEAPGSKPTESTLRDEGEFSDAPPVLQHAASTFESSSGQPSTIEEAPGVKLLLFYAANSQPSTLMQPIAKDVAKQFPGMAFVLVEASTNTALTEKFDVDAVPTCLLTRDGKPLTKVVGQVTAEKLRLAIHTAVAAEAKKVETKPAQKPVGTSLPHGPTLGDWDADGTKLPKPAATERILVAYQIPRDLAHEIDKLWKTRHLQGVWDERHRFVVQASREDHASLSSILKETPKWRDPSAAQQRIKQPLVMSEVDGEPVLEWRSAGLTFKRETRPEYLAMSTPGGVEIVKVAPGSLADWQSLRSGDSLASIEQFRIGSLEELKSVMESLLEGFSKNSKTLDLLLVRQRSDTPELRNLDYHRAGVPLRPDELAIEQADQNRRIRESDELIERSQAKQLALAEAERQRATATPTPGRYPPPDAGPADQNANPPATSTKKDSSDLRYDGKSLDEWRAEWRTELSTQKRHEAVKALAAFGRAGHGEEAAEAILDVAGEYDFNLIDKSEEGKLKQTILGELAPLGRQQPMAEHWVPSLAARLEKDPKKWRWLAYNLLRRLQTDDKDTTEILRSLAQTGPAEVRAAAIGALVDAVRLQSNGPQIDDATQKLLTAALKSEDPTMIHAAASALLYQPPPGGEVQLVFQPESVPLLFHADKTVQMEARQVLARIQDKNAPQAVESLLSILKDESRKSDRLAAIRALGAIGPKAAAAQPQLEQVFGDDSQDMVLRVAAAIALDRIEGGQRLGNVLSNMINNAPHEKIQTKMIQLLNAERQITGQ